MAAAEFIARSAHRPAYAVHCCASLLPLIAIILGITGWSGAAIVLRAQARSLRTLEYTAAALVSGESGMRIIFVEIVPNLLPLTAAQFIFGPMAAVLGEAGLSYLGLGPTGSVTLGTMLNDAQTGQAVGAGAWWWGKQKERDAIMNQYNQLFIKTNT